MAGRKLHPRNFIGPARKIKNTRYVPTPADSASATPASRPRPARVTKYDAETGMVYIEWLDRINKSNASGAEVTTVPFQVTMPYMGLGWGIYAGIEKGSECLVGTDSRKRLYIAAWRPNPIYFDSSRMKDAAKTLGYKFKSDAPMYPVYRVLSEGDVALLSRSSSGIYALDNGTVKVLSGYGQKLEFIPDLRATYFTAGTFRVISEAGSFLQGVVRRYHKGILALPTYDIVTRLIAHSTGLVDLVPVGATSVPSVVNPAYTEVYNRLVELADNVVGIEKALKDPMIITREGTVIGDGEISGEKAFNGKALAMGSDPDSSAIPAVLPTLAMWFRKQFSKLTAKFEFRINKLGRMQLYSAPPLGEIEPTKNGVSLETKTGALRIKIDALKNPELKSVVLQDTFGNQITLSVTGYEIKDKIGNTVTMKPTGIVIKDMIGNKVDMGATQLKVSGTLKVFVTAPIVQMNGQATPPGILGPFCAIPTCPFSTAPHVSKTAVGG